MRKAALSVLLILCGCFTFRSDKYLTDAQTLCKDVSILTTGKLGGDGWVPSRYGAIDADLLVVEANYGEKNPLSLAQVHDFEANYRIFRRNDSLGANPGFWKRNAPALNQSAQEIVNGELKKNTQ